MTRARRAATAAALFTCVIAGAAAFAQAPPPRVALRWSAPPECPSSSEVLAEVDRILGERGARPPKPLDVSVTVTGARGAYQVRVETAGTDATRVRTLTGKTCAALTRATALVLALVIDPNAVPPPPSPTSSAPPTAPSTPPTSPGAALSPATTARPANATPAPTIPAGPLPPPARGAADHRDRSVLRSVRLSVWAGADAGSLPAIAPGFGVEVAAIFGRLRVGAGVELYPEQDTLVHEDTPFGGSIRLIAGYGGACLPFALGTFELAPCAALELGQMHAKGFGASSNGTNAALWAAPTGGGLIAWFPWSFVGLRLRAEVVVPVNRPSFILLNVGAVHRAGPVAGRLQGGLEARF